MFAWGSCAAAALILLTPAEPAAHAATPQLNITACKADDPGGIIYGSSAIECYDLCREVRAPRCVPSWRAAAPALTCFAICLPTCPLCGLLFFTPRTRRLATQEGVNIIVAAYGVFGVEPFTRWTVERLADAGILLVASAGERSALLLPSPCRHCSPGAPPTRAATACGAPALPQAQSPAWPEAAAISPRLLCFQATKLQTWTPFRSTTALIRRRSPSPCPTSSLLGHRTKATTWQGFPTMAGESGALRLRRARGEPRLGRSCARCAARVEPRRPPSTPPPCSDLQHLCKSGGPRNQRLDDQQGWGLQAGIRHQPFGPACRRHRCAHVGSAPRRLGRHRQVRCMRSGCARVAE